MNGDDDVFADAVSLPAAERAAFLAVACADAPQRARIEALLCGHDRAQELFNSPLTPRFTRAPEETVGALIGRYRLVEKIGEGGMGVVYKAEQLEPVRREVALKIIKLGMDTTEVITRFEAERQALAMMDHPSIARVFDGGATDAGRPFFVMELVRGMKITEYCDEARLSTHDRLELFIQVCQAIQHAHQKGIIHRDIKPSNILVTVSDGVAVPKVIDFGIAKATQGRLTNATLVTQFEMLIGTPAYMSPEQAIMTSVDIDTRSDIYSLGVLLYELLAGRPPFDAKELLASGLDAMRKTIREKEPLRPSWRLATLQGEELTTAAKRRSSDTSKLRHQLQGDLDWIVMKCLEKDRARRYETANGLTADLRRHLNNEAVLARPPSTVYRFQKLVRRNTLVFAALTSIAVVLALGAVVSTWQAIRATRASASATAQRRLAETQRNIAVEQRKLANLQLALQAWEEGDLQRANDLIEASRPESGQLSGFEWRHLRKLVRDSSYETFSGTNHHYRSAQFFGRDLLLLNDGKALTLQDIFHRKNQLMLADQDGIWTPAFCSGNANLLATLADDGRIKVWDLAARRVRTELEGHSRSLTMVDSASTAAVESPTDRSNITFSRDGRWLASGTLDKYIKLWDLEAENPKPVRTLHRYTYLTCGGVFSPDGRNLFTGGSEPIIRVWDVASGTEAGPALEGHTSWVYALTVSPDGLRLASAGADSTVIVWDLITRKIVTKLLGHIAQVNVLAFSADGKILASAGRDQSIRLWDPNSGQQLSLLRGQGTRVNRLSFSPDAQLLVSRSPDGLVKLWQVNVGQDRNVLIGGGSALEVALSPDGQRLASVGSSEVHLWNLATRSRTVLNGHTQAVMCAIFSPDGAILATGGHDEIVILWDVSDLKAVATFTNGFPVGSLAFSPDGRTLIVGGSEHHFLVGNRGGLLFWDVPSQRATGAIPGDTSDIVQVALTGNGSLLAAGHRDGAVSLWDAQTRRLLHRFEGVSGGAVMSLAFSPLEPLLAASDFDGNIVLYDTTSMEMVPPPMKAHSGRVTSLAFSPDGHTLASAGEGGGLKLWHMATRQMALTLKGHVGAVKGITFSRDGSFMVSSGLDGTVRLWPAMTPQEADAAIKANKKNQ